MRPHGVLTIALLAAGCTCGPDRLQPSAGGLSFEPARVAVAAPTPLTLQSTVPDALTVTLTVPAPFAVTPSTVDLPAHGSAVVTVTFDLPEGGTLTRTLEARAGSRVATAELTGARACAPAPPCQTARVDAKSGFCTYGAAPDGTACSDACLVNAACASGACVGSAKPCADDDACTVDACQAGTGCVHLPCDALQDPCKTGQCTATGCVFREVPDGTACGPADCVEARVCVAGACATRPVPEGAACQAPCGTGTCANAACVLDAGTALTPEWVTAVAEDFSIASTLPADAAGNVYWLEVGKTFDRLVSTTATGFQRWAVTLGTEQRFFASRPLMVDDARGLVLVVAPSGRLLARRLADGAAAWSRVAVNDLFPATEVDPGDFGHIWGTSGGAPLLVSAVTYAAAGGSPKREQLFALDPATGQTLWKQAYGGFAAARRDEASNAYLRTATPAGWTVRKVDPAGALVWVSPKAMPSEVAAVHDGRVYLTHGEALSTATGAVAFPSPFVPDDEQSFGSLQYLEGDWLASKAVAYLSLGQYAAPRRVHPQSGALLWIRNASAYRPTDGLLTANGLRLLVEQRYLGVGTGWVWHLGALTPAGHEAWACALPDFGWYHLEGVTLVKERLVVTGHASNPVPQAFPMHVGAAGFALPGLKVGPGWSVTTVGSLARDHAPQR